MPYQTDMCIKTKIFASVTLIVLKILDAQLEVIFLNYRFIKWRSVKFWNKAFLNKNKQKYTK